MLALRVAFILNIRLGSLLDISKDTSRSSSGLLS